MRTIFEAKGKLYWYTDANGERFKDEISWNVSAKAKYELRLSPLQPLVVDICGPGLFAFPRCTYKPAPKRPRAHPQQSRRLILRQTTTLPVPKRLLKHHYTPPLAMLGRPHLVLPSNRKRPKIRPDTLCAPKPDQLCALYTLYTATRR